MAAIIGHANHQRSWVEANDDQLYLAALATRFADSPRFESVVRGFSPVVHERGDAPIRAVRYDLRHVYKNNYAGVSYINNLVFDAVSKASLSDSSFEYRTALSTSITYIITAGTALLVLLLTLTLSRDGRLFTAVAIMGLIAVWESTVNFGGSVRLIHNGPGVLPNPFDIVLRFARLMIDPGNSSFIFGAGPRCAFILLLLSIFILRWQGRVALAYWLFVPMTFVHQSYAGLFLVIVASLDLLQRPRILFSLPVLAPIAIAVVLFVVRESLWLVVGTKGPIALLLLLAFAAILGLSIRSWFPDFYSNFVGLWERLQSRLRAVHPSMADAILLIAGWTLFLLFTSVGNYFATPAQSLFFWGHSAGRIFSAIRPALLVAFIYAILVRMPQASQRRYALPAAIIALACIALVTMLRWPPNTIRSIIDRNTIALKEIDTRLKQPISVFKSSTEPLIYYGIAKSVITGKDELIALRTRP